MHIPRWWQNWQRQAEGNLQLEKLDVPRDAEPRASFGAFFKDHDVSLALSLLDRLFTFFRRLRLNPTSSALGKVHLVHLRLPKSLKRHSVMSPGADNFPEFFADSPAQRIQWLSTRTFRLFFAVTFVWFIPLGNLKKLLVRSFAGTNTECPWVYMASSLDST